MKSSFLPRRWGRSQLNTVSASFRMTRRYSWPTRTTGAVSVVRNCRSQAGTRSPPASSNGNTKIHLTACSRLRACSRGSPSSQWMSCFVRSPACSWSGRIDRRALAWEYCSTVSGGAHPTRTSRAPHSHLPCDSLAAYSHLPRTSLAPHSRLTRTLRATHSRLTRTLRAPHSRLTRRRRHLPQTDAHQRHR